MSEQHISPLAAALAKAQSKITSPPRNREVEVYSKRTNSKYKFRYATLDCIIDHVRPALTENGIWFTQTLEAKDDGKYKLVTELLHESGERLRSETPLLVEDNGNQAFGSALTYMRRYALTAMLGVAADEDDDGNAADGNSIQSQKDKNKAPPKKAAPKPEAANGKTPINGDSEPEGKSFEIRPDRGFDHWDEVMHRAIEKAKDIETLTRLQTDNAQTLQEYGDKFQVAHKALMDAFTRKASDLSQAPADG